MEITIKKLKELNACQESIDAFPGRWGESVDSLELLRSLRDRGYFDWANWLLTNLLTTPNLQIYCINAARLVYQLWREYDEGGLWWKWSEEFLSGDDRKEAREGAWEAARAASAASWEAMEAREGAWEAARAASRASREARDGVWAAGTASWAASASREARASRAARVSSEVVWAAGEKEEEIKLSILDFGISLL